MRTSLKLSIAGMVFLALAIITFFGSLLVGIVFFVLFLIFLIAAWIAAVSERGGIMAWFHRRRVEQQQYDAAKRDLKWTQAKGYYDEKGRIAARKRFDKR